MNRINEIRVRMVLFAMAVLSMAWGYRLLLLDHAPTVFNGVMEDLSYGWYVPLFSLYVLWRERCELVRSLGDPSLAGLVLLVPSFFIGFLGVRGSQIRFEILGVVGMLISARDCEACAVPCAFPAFLHAVALIPRCRHDSSAPVGCIGGVRRNEGRRC